MQVKMEDPNKNLSADKLEEGNQWDTSLNMPEKDIETSLFCVARCLL